MSTFYSCTDAENLTHETEEEAIEDYLESWMTVGADVPALIRERSPITVFRYDAVRVSKQFTDRVTRRVLEMIAREFSEEYGNPEGDGDELDITDGDPALEAAVAALIAKGEVWACEVTSERGLEAEEVEKMMREYRPSWFEQ